MRSQGTSHSRGRSQGTSHSREVRGLRTAGESATNGRVTQAQIRNGIPPGQNGGLGDGNMVKYIANSEGGSATYIKAGSFNSPTQVINEMDKGTKFFANLSGGEGISRHEVLLNRVDSRLIFKPNGTVIRKFRYFVMDPARGQYIRLSGRSLQNANIWMLKF